MATDYTIYLVNESADVETFWCFLAPPQELVDDPGVFANSSASLAVAPNSPAINSFTIPIQYIVGAGASNNAVGLNVEIISNVTNQAALTQTWDANYATVPPNMGPSMAAASTQSSPNTIAIVTNNFNKVTNEDAGWFSNQSFGIESEAGFIGMTWSPSPGMTRTLTPNLTFYVATGDYGSNALASWDDVSTNAATIQVPADFSLNKCTVTLTASGGWQVTPGEPPSMAMVQNLDWFQSEAHHELMALSYLETGAVATDTVQSVSWGSTDSLDDAGDIVLTGTLTVTAALTAAFTYFVLSGVQFTINRPQQGVTTFQFTYSGSQSAQAIKDLFTAGAQILLGGGR